MSKPNKEISQILLQFSDGTKEIMSQGLVAHITGAGDVLIQTKELGVPQFFMLLAALEEAAKQYLEG